MFVLVAGIGLGWIGRRVQQARNHRAAAAELRQSGATITFDENGWAKTVKFPCVESVNAPDFEFVENAPVLDAELVHLKALPKLEELDLGGSSITDAGLVHLKGLTKLETIILTRTKVTDAGLEHLNRIRIGGRGSGRLARCRRCWLHES